MTKPKFGSFSLRDDSLKETQKRLREIFEIHKFKYIEETLTLEEREILLKHGTKFQMFEEGKMNEFTEEYRQIIDGPDKATGPFSKPVQVWFKYQAMLKAENEGRKQNNKRLAEENDNRFRRYHGE